MSTSGQPPLERVEPPTADQTRELLQFLRQENDANRTAVRDDSIANRKLLLDTVKVVSIPVTVLILIASWFGFRSISDLKATLESEGRRSTQAEIVRMQGEIRNRLQEQFQTAALQKTVKDAAVDATKTAAEPLIKSEVATQVKLRVDAERPTIAATVAQQTRLAVKQMEPEIQSLVKASVDTTISTSVDPMIQRVREQSDLQLLITRMNADDALAYDTLLPMVNSGSPEQRGIVLAAVRSVISAHNSGMFQLRQFSSVQTPDQLVSHLTDADAFSRQAALDLLPATNKLTLLPTIVGMMRSDPSINTRCSAYRVFNNWTGQSFQCLDSNSLAWWENNKQKFPRP